MCTTCNPALDLNTADADVEAFADRVVGFINGGAMSLLLSIGHQTGLLDAMGDGEPCTIDALAAKVDLSRRYVQEWLGGLTAAEIVEHDGEAGTYRLPPAHGACLTRDASPNNLAAATQWIGLLGGVEGEVVEAFYHGRGVPYSKYARFNEVMAGESDQTVVAALDDHVLPLIPCVLQKLGEGIDVLDVGCGRGKALMHLAERFPKSRFVGRDLLQSAVDAATAEAEQRGLANVRFEQMDAAKMNDRAAFDFITTFDAVHDQANPAGVVKNIFNALKPDGLYLCQEIKAETDHADNVGKPLAPFIYTISLMHCMSVSLAGGGAGLGAAWGRTQCRDTLERAGFTTIVMKELPHDIQNDWYICKA